MIRLFSILATVAVACLLGATATADTPATQHAPSTMSETLGLCISADDAQHLLSPSMGECCRVNVKGCGKKAQICVE